MAYNYVRFAASLSLPSFEAQEYALELAEDLKVRHAKECTGYPQRLPKVPRALSDAIEGWEFNVVEDGGTPGIIIDGGESGGPESAALFMQHLIQKFCPDQTAQISWADFCDERRIDEFHGGAAFITANKIEWLSTAQWLSNKMKDWTDGQRLVTLATA